MAQTMHSVRRLIREWVIAAGNGAGGHTVEASTPRRKGRQPGNSGRHMLAMLDPISIVGTYQRDDFLAGPSCWQDHNGASRDPSFTLVISLGERSYARGLEQFFCSHLPPRSP